MTMRGFGEEWGRSYLRVPFLPYFSVLCWTCASDNPFCSVTAKCFRISAVERANAFSILNVDLLRNGGTDYSRSENM